MVRDLPDYLKAGDALVVNDTKVIPARLRGMRLRDAVPPRSKSCCIGGWRRIAIPRWRGRRASWRWAIALQFGDLAAAVAARGEAGEAEVAFAAVRRGAGCRHRRAGRDAAAALYRGQAQADARDAADYQTVFARDAGSVAAPTAGLHFTPELFAALAAKGVTREQVTLHVGLGTFLPVTARIPRSIACMPNARHAGRRRRPRGSMRVHAAGGRIVAVGTTSLRTLESATDADGTICAL